MELNDIVQVISNLGFPIFVTVYMMVVNNKTLKELTEAITTLSYHIKGQEIHTDSHE